jgi:hypothetical protein
MRKIITRKFPRRLAASLVLATGAALLAPAVAPASAAVAAAPCLDVTGVPPAGPTLNEVTVQTACSAWATTKTATIDRWDGANWTAQQVAILPGSTTTVIYAVTATSAASAWAAGSDVPAASGNIDKPLIEHWNGTAWAVSASPTLHDGDIGVLTDLSTSSAADAWAVGGVFFTQQGPTGVQAILTEHWDGKAWTQVPAPTPAGETDTDAAGVADISPTNAWMVGSPQGAGGPGPAWVEHWDGTAWTAATVAGMPADSQLNAVRALSATNVWAVGTTRNPAAHAESPLILHYDGTSWTVMSSIPSPGTVSALEGVAVTSTGAMAVGRFTDASGTQRPLVMLWNGTTWSQLPTPSLGTDANLTGVGGTSNNYWAVGDYGTINADNPLALHCC